jgi:hypothetical protein
MSTDFSVFRNRFAEACRVRDMKPEAVYRSIGLGGRRTLDFQSIGLRALDLYRVCQIADRLNGESLDGVLASLIVIARRRLKASTATRLL